MLKVEKITSKNACFYKKFSFDKYYDDLSSKGHKTIIKIGVTCNNTPCGAVLAKQNTNDKTTLNILTFFVSKNFRKKGAGSLLIKNLITSAKKSKYKKITFEAITSKESIKNLEFFLTNYGFSQFKILSNIYRANAKELLKNSPFIKACQNLTFKLPSNVEILEKSKVDKSLLLNLKAKQGIDYPKKLSYFVNECNLKEAFTYFAIKNKKEIIGWQSTFDAPGNLILYRSLFVKEEYRNSSVGFFVVTKAINHHLTHFQSHDILFAVARENTKTQRFLTLLLKNTFTHKKFEFYTLLNI